MIVDLLSELVISQTVIGTGGGGETCHDFGYGCAAGVPGPHPIHILGQVKNTTHSYAF